MEHFIPAKVLMPAGGPGANLTLEACHQTDAWDMRFLCHCFSGGQSITSTADQGSVQQPWPIEQQGYEGGPPQVRTVRKATRASAW